MPTSTLPAVKAALVALLQQAEWPTPDPVVAYGMPRDLPTELVMVGGSVAWDQDWANIGGLRRTETYTLDVVINVVAAGLSQQEATERTFVLLAVVEDTLRTTPGVGVTVGTATANVLWGDVVPTQLVEVPSTEGYEAEIRLGVRVTARI